MLKDLLESQNCFKLICGAGNEDINQVKKLVAIYAAAGCHFFDFSANKNVLIAAQEGLDLVIQKEEQKDFHFCISVGTKNDPHITKAKINTAKCVNCGKCFGTCPQNAIKTPCKVCSTEQKTEITEEKCIGCLKCQKFCKFEAIETYQKTNSIEEIFEELKDFIPKLSCIELHASEEDETDAVANWDFLSKNFDGILSLCLGRNNLSNSKFRNRIKNLTKNRQPYSTIIQTDGSPMSGGKNDFKTTLQAIAAAEIVQNMDIPVYIMPSGGTNAQTAELAKLCEVKIHGVAIGSYARKIIAPFLENDNLFTETSKFEDAKAIASELILASSFS